ncbi:MAG: hypothetical protein NTW19_19335 [Planctomycetota bacterium]|nr:hypothetical protein [Planctomycetota bacterium]
MACLALLLAATSGCASYRLRGRVIEVKGAAPQMIVVNADDPRLQQPGLPYSSLEVTIDPNALKPLRVPLARVDEHGDFDITIEQPGAGVLDFKLAVVARSQGHQPLIDETKLPASFRRILILLPTGRDNYRPEADSLQDSLRFEKDMKR